MKRIAFLIAIATMTLAPIAHAQDHAEIGAFADYFRLNQTDTNFVGLALGPA